MIGEKVEKVKGHYEKKDVFQRYQNIVKRFTEEDQEEDKKEAVEGGESIQHGVEIWGIGYMTSDHSEDLDSEEAEGEDYAYNEDLKRKILSYATSGGQVDFEMEEMESISSSLLLSEIYQYRWWSDADTDSYLVMINKTSSPFLKGSQIHYNYGRRNNSYLMQK